MSIYLSKYVLFNWAQVAVSSHIYFQNKWPRQEFMVFAQKQTQLWFSPLKIIHTSDFFWLVTLYMRGLYRWRWPTCAIRGTKTFSTERVLISILSNSHFAIVSNINSFQCSNPMAQPLNHQERKSNRNRLKTANKPKQQKLLCWCC